MPKWTKEQQSAIDLKGTNIIVSAGAGSGKTAVLTARVGRILSEGTHIDELLILTFTKAAAGEMKERIRKFIKSNPELRKELDLIDSAYITTFDSFALSVVKKYHYLLNISNNINITDSSIIAIKKQEIMDEIFAEYYLNPSKEFTELINNFCVKDDKNLTSSFLKIANTLELLPNKLEYLKNYFNNYFNPNFLNKIINDYQNLLLSKVQELKLVVEDFKYLITSDYYQKIMETLDNLFQAQTIDEVLINLSFRFPSLPKGSDEEIKNYKEQKITPLIKQIQNIAQYGNQETLIKNYNLTQNNIKIIIEILIKYFTKLEEYKLTNEIYDFQDIALLAIKIVANFESARNELKNKFKEIMIDEYQDTNDIQETFINYIENNNVYMVGDIKQSIYRFRNANPYIFKNKYDQYSQHHNGEKIDLLKNFRSRSEVLDNINLIFCTIMDDLIGGADYIATHQMIFGNNAYIEEGKTSNDYNLQILEYSKNQDFTNEEIEIFTIAQDIKKRLQDNYQIFDKDNKELRPATYKDFVILMDRATNFELYKKIFEYLNIPLTIYKDEKLNDSTELSIIKNALIFINQIYNKKFDTQFRYAFTSLARSFLYELNDQTIFNCFQNNDFINNPVYQELAPIAENLNQKSTLEILYSIIETTKYYQKLIKVGEIEASTIRITKLLELTQNLADNGYDINGFINYLETIIKNGFELKYSVGATSENSVKIMTIHKSKGLEYHICYFSGLYKAFNIGDIKEKFTYSKQYGIITPIFDEGISEIFTKELIKQEYLNEEISEKIRLFYVGLTRAKEQMIILLPENSKQITTNFNDGVVNNIVRTKYRSFADFIYSISKLLKKYTIHLDQNTLNLSKDYLYPKEINKAIDKTNQTINVSEINIPNSLVEEKSFSKKMSQIINTDTYNNIQLGLKFHETLEYIDLKNYDSNLIPDKFISSKISNFLSQPILLNIKEANIYQEHEFIYEDNNNIYHGIIDLMLEYQDHIDIIDYKLSNIEDTNYLKQLTGYKNYINSKTNKNVNIYLYSILTNELKKLNA